MNEYYKCTTCNKIFADEAGTTETTLEALKINAAHSLVHHEAVDATTTTSGNIEYWSCSKCGKYFSDEAGTTEITDKTSVEVKYYSKGLAYMLTDDGTSYFVSGIGTCEYADIIIPSKYNDGENGLHSVISISERAFYSNNNITSVIISDGITSIGSYAFYGCSKLKNVVFADSVTNIERYAFWDCTKLATIYIPISVTSIGSS